MASGQKAGFVLLHIVGILYIIFMIMNVFGNFGGFSFLSGHFGRHYTLPDANVSVGVDANGTSTIHEAIAYDFSGCYHGVYRTTTLPEAGRQDVGIPNTGPAYTAFTGSCTPSCQVGRSSNELDANFGQICDRTATFHVNMTVIRSVLAGQDTDLFQYKVWGDGWTVQPGHLSATITFPRDISDVPVLVAPAEGVSYHKSGRTLTLEASGFSSYVEVAALFPKGTFDTPWKDPSMSTSSVLAAYSSYDHTFRTARTVILVIVALFFLAVVLLPVYLYRRYGTEPDVAYDQPYEREPPAVKPAVANALIMGDTGKSDQDAVIATVLDLVRRKHIGLEQVKVTRKTLLFGEKTEKDMRLTFLSNPDDAMSGSEQAAYDFLKGYAADGSLLWSDFTKRMRGTERYALQKFTRDFAKKVKAEYDLKTYFDDTGSKYFRVLAGIVVGLAFITFLIGGLFSLMDPTLARYFSLLRTTAIVSGIAAIAGLFVHNQVFGRFTPDGLLFYRKGKAYRRYLSDLTLLKRYPPASIVIWEECLVYAAALGAAKTVEDQMQAMAPAASAAGSGLYVASSMGFATGFSTVYASASPGSAPAGGGFSGGGFGGVGGGFGGGGGGAF